MIKSVLFTCTRDDLGGRDRDVDVIERGWIALRHRQAPCERRLSIVLMAVLSDRRGSSQSWGKVGNCCCGVKKKFELKMQSL